MAIRTAENTNVAGPLSKIAPGYKGVATLRVVSSKFGPSKSGMPMISLETEIVEPRLVKSDLDGQEYDMTGLTVSYYLMMNETNKDGKPSDNFQFLVQELLPRLGLESRIDDENPLFDEEKNPSGIKLDGLCFDALISTENRIEKSKLPDGRYIDVIDPATGKPLMKGWSFVAQTRDILRSATVEA